MTDIPTRTPPSLSTMAPIAEPAIVSAGRGKRHHKPGDWRPCAVCEDAYERGHYDVGVRREDARLLSPLVHSLLYVIDHAAAEMS